MTMTWHQHPALRATSHGVDCWWIFSDNRQLGWPTIRDVASHCSRGGLLVISLKAPCQLGLTGRGHTELTGPRCILRNESTAKGAVTGCLSILRIDKVLDISGTGQSLYPDDSIRRVSKSPNAE
jgi:hypothetical protein